MEHQEYKELLELFALNAPEARSLEAHLNECGECRAELAGLRDASALLAHASTPVAPSNELRARVLKAANTDMQTQKPTSSVVSISERRSSYLLPNLLKIAAAVAIVGLAIGLFVTWRSEVKSQREIARLNHELTLQQRQVNREHDARMREHDALTLLSSNDAKKMELAGTATAK